MTPTRHHVRDAGEQPMRPWIHPRNCRLFCYALVASALTIAPPTMVEGAAISWSSAFAVDDPTDIVVPAIGQLHFAADFNTETGFDPEPDDDDIVNGVPLTRVDSDGISGLLSHSFSSGPNFGAASFPGGTGDADLDNLLNSHSWIGGDPTTASVTLEGLTPGVPYQIQVIGAVDLRSCCSARAYEPDDGEGNFTTGINYTRGDAASILGTFTADANTQTFQWRSLSDEAGNNDPGMSALVVHSLVPEPGGFVLVSLALGLVVVASRRR